MTMEEYNDLPDYIPGLDDGEWGEAEQEWTLRYCKVDRLKSVWYNTRTRER
jgi:hypothetical protein